MKGTKGQFKYTIHPKNGEVFEVITPEHTDARDSRNEMMRKYPNCGLRTKVIVLSCCKEIVGTKTVPKGMIIG